MQKIFIPPQRGKAFKLQSGKQLKVIDVEGGQVADLLAFNEQDPAEMLSTGATIDYNASIRLQQGDYLFSNHYNRMLRLVEDRVKQHDLLHPACSPAMFRHQYGIEEYHPSCLENFQKALTAYGIKNIAAANPFNIFMHSRVDSYGRVEIHKPLSGAGDYVVLEATMDLIIAVTACSVAESACNAYRCTGIAVEIAPG